MDQVGRAWKADLSTLFDQLSPFTGIQQQIAAAMPKFDLSTILPKFEVPTFLTDDTMRTLSQAAVATSFFDQLPVLAGFQQQIAAAMPKFDLSTILPTLIPPSFTNESLGQLHAAALRIAASLPLDGHDDVRPLLPDRSDTDSGDHVGLEEEVLLLLLTVFALIATVHLEAAEPLSRVVSSLIESGVVLADLIGQVYNALSQNSPDDKLLSWVLLFAAILRSIRRSDDNS